MYEVGRVYVWQNCSGVYAHLNGVETTVTSLPIEFIGITYQHKRIGQRTDTIGPSGNTVMAERGDLRPKNPPTGEQKIRSMFEPKPVMEVA